MAADPDFPMPGDDPVEQAAAVWLARRERGLTPAEQDGYLQWLHDSPEHSQAVARLEKTWQSLDVLGDHLGLRDTRPLNPDLLAPHRRLKRVYFAYAFALAAAVVLLIALWPRSVSSDAKVALVHPPAAVPPQRLTLPDGSVVDLHGARVEPEFTTAIRRVRLLAGEAHFAVAKNPERPFIVDTGHVTVRAVGTAFDVVRNDASVEVVVTEGKVQVQRIDPAASAEAAIPAAVEAGQRAFVNTGSPGAAPVVSALSTRDIDQALAWRDVRLEFSDTPLGDVVAEFNRRNARHLVFGDSETPKLLVGGNFRADNVDAFVRLLEDGFGVTAERREDGTVVLRLAK